MSYLAERMGFIAIFQIINVLAHWRKSTFYVCIRHLAADYICQIDLSYSFVYLVYDFHNACATVALLSQFHN